MPKKLQTCLFLVCLLSLSCGGGFYLYLKSWSATPRTVSSATPRTVSSATQGTVSSATQGTVDSNPKTKGIEFDLLRGQSLSSFASELEQKTIVDHAKLFELAAKSQFRNFKAGHYLANPKITPNQLISMVSEGKIYEKVVLQITIPEGFNLHKIGRRLAANGIGTYRDFIKLSHDKQYLKKKKLHFAKSLEGFLYPLTYSFYEIPKLRDVTDLMIKTFWKNLPSTYEQQVLAKGLNLYQAVTFASLIELETKLDRERPLVSEVIWNRLRRNAPLGIDAAIIYGIKNYKGDIRSIHLKDKNNPYNTRLHNGLPPTPIGSPSASSLLAVLNPSSFGYYFYVLKKPGEDEHFFSKTLTEHNRQVRKFLSYH